MLEYIVNFVINAIECVNASSHKFIQVLDTVDLTADWAALKASAD